MVFNSSNVWFHSDWDMPDLATMIRVEGSVSSPLDDDEGNNLSEGDVTIVVDAVTVLLSMVGASILN